MDYLDDREFEIAYESYLEELEDAELDYQELLRLAYGGGEGEMDYRELYDESNVSYYQE